MRRQFPEFCPVDDEGAVARQAQTIEELEGLAQWFLNPSPQAQAVRKRAYERAGQGVASPAAKGEVFALSAGEFLHRHLLEINAKADEENRLDDLAAPGEGAPDIGRARKTLQALLMAFKEELFGQAMANARMNPAEVEDLIELLKRDHNAFRSMAASALERDAQAAVKRLDEYWTLPESRDQILKGAPSPSGEDWGIYAPLLKNFSEKATPSQVAEFMTRFDLYIRSGWHQKDLEDAIARADDPAPSGLGAMLREVARARAGEAVGNPWTAAFEALGERFSELFLPLRVSCEGGAFRESAKAAMKEGPAFGASGMAGSGMVDAALASPDGSRLFVAFATSDRFIQNQNNQWLRHSHAIINSMRDEPGQWRARGVSPEAQVTFSVCAPASLASDEGRSIQALFDKMLSDKARQDIELFAFISALADSQAKLDELAWFDPKIAGCKPEAWQEARAQAKEIPGKHGQALMGAQFVEHLGGLCKEFQRCGLKSELNVSATSAKRAGSWLLKSMMTCISAATKYAKDDETGLVKQRVLDNAKAIGSFLNKISATADRSSDEDVVFGCQGRWERFLKEAKAKPKKAKTAKAGR